MGFARYQDWESALIDNIAKALAKESGVSMGYEDWLDFSEDVLVGWLDYYNLEWDDLDYQYYREAKIDREENDVLRHVATSVLEWAILHDKFAYIRMSDDEFDTEYNRR